MNIKKLVPFLLILAVGLSACNKTVPQSSVQPQSSAASHGSIPAPIESSVKEETVAEEASSADDWNPTEENTFRYLDWDGNTNGFWKAGLKHTAAISMRKFILMIPETVCSNHGG